MKFLMGGWLYDYSFGCQPVDFSNSPQALRVRQELIGFGWKARGVLHYNLTILDGECMLGFLHV